MKKTLEEWIALYNRKNYEEFKRDEKFELFYLPEKGFAEIADTVQKGQASPASKDTWFITWEVTADDSG